MPSKVVDVHRFTSSSHLSEEMLDPIEKQMGFWKVDCLSHPYGAKLVDTISQETHAVGSKRPLTNSLDFLKHVNQDSQGSSNAHIHTSSYISEGGRLNMNGSQYESGLFSSSLSDLFSRKLRFSSNNSVYGHSVDTVGPPHMEEEPFESLKEIEAQTIGNLLPDDDDLLSGTIPGVEFTVQSCRRDDIEDLDLFSSVGGMDLGDERSSAGTNFSGGISSGHPVGYNGTVACKQPDGELASRTLFVRNINTSMEDSELQALFERYGDIQKLYTACEQSGFMISYFDIRSASMAMSELQNKSFKHGKLDIHFSIPKENLLEEDIDLATLAVYNLDSSMSDDELRRTFSVYGDIKEIRGSSDKSHHKIVEFYDVRAAQAALHAPDNIYVAGKLVRVEPSRLGFARQSIAQQEVEHDDIRQLNGTPCSSTRLSSSMTSGNNMGLKSELRASIRPFLENSYYHSVSSSVPNSLSSIGRAESVGSHSGFLEMGQFYEQLNFGYQGIPGSYPHSLPEHHDSFPGNLSRSRVGNSGLSSGMHAGLRSNRSSINVNGGYPGNITSSISGHEYAWNHGYHHQHPGMIWPRASSYGTDSSRSARPMQQLYGIPTPPAHMLNPVSPISDNHVGSAPTVNPSLWDRQHAFSGESAKASSFHPGSLGSLRTFKNSLHAMGFAHHSNFNHGDRNSLDPSIPPRNIELHSHDPRCLMFPGRGPSSFDSSNERTRGRKTESVSGHGDNKKQFELDLERIMRGQDKRTTLMIKNIPNKYTSKMLLAAIDERHKGTYDFIYLPIDFKNKCNVGYAFINMTVPGFIIPFYQTFHGKKWEKFNSEKVASLAYARIQGKAALVAHFQNSSLMNEDKRCRPILFITDGPNAGDQVPFPVGINIRSRSGKARTSGNDDQESPRSLRNGDGFSGSDSSSVSAKDSD